MKSTHYSAKTTETAEQAKTPIHKQAATTRYFLESFPLLLCRRILFGSSGIF